MVYLRAIEAAPNKAIKRMIPKSSKITTYSDNIIVPIVPTFCKGTTVGITFQFVFIIIDSNNPENSPTPIAAGSICIVPVFI